VARVLGGFWAEGTIVLPRGLVGRGCCWPVLSTLPFWLRRNNSRRCFSSAVSVAPDEESTRLKPKSAWKEQMAGNFKLMEVCRIIIK
jgi:hypothetical protein